MSGTRLPALCLLSASGAAVASGPAFAVSGPQPVSSIVRDGPSVARAPRSAAPAAESLGSRAFGCLVAGGAALSLALRNARRSRVERKAVESMNIPQGGFYKRPDTTPDYVQFYKQRKFAKNMGRQRYYKQQIILRANKIECGGWKGYTKWYPNQEAHNFYKGPESHPDNPWFPHYSPGFRKKDEWLEKMKLERDKNTRVKALQPTGFGGIQLASSVTPGTSTFAGASSVKRGFRALSARSSKSAMVMHAHKKTSASTKNQGHVHNWKFRGVCRCAGQGSAVSAGQILVMQTGMNWYAGSNVKRTRTYNLISCASGIVQWRGSKKHYEVSVIPWQYVNEKCVRVNSNTLGPKEYAPWMGIGKVNRRAAGSVQAVQRKVATLRAEWEETDEGKAWLKKKEEKKQKTEAWKAYMREDLKKRKYQKKGNRLRKAAREARKAEREAKGEGNLVAAGDSDSEKE